MRSDGLPEITFHSTSYLSVCWSVLCLVPDEGLGCWLERGAGLFGFGKPLNGSVKLDRFRQSAAKLFAPPATLSDGSHLLRGSPQAQAQQQPPAVQTSHHLSHSYSVHIFPTLMS